MSNGEFLAILEHPRMGRWNRVLLFLTDGEWSHSPIVSRHAFRIETIGGRDVLVDQDGAGVVGVGKRGLLRGPQVFDLEEVSKATPSFEQDPSSDAFDKLVEKNDLLQTVAMAVQDRVIGYSGAGFDSGPTHPNGDWRQLGYPTPSRPEDVNPNPCEEQLRDKAGIECLGGDPEQPGSYSVEEMEACLKGVGK